MPPNPAEVKQAELLRNDGNNYFKKSRFGAAIDAYTQVLFGFFFGYRLLFFLGFLKCFDFDLTYFVFHRNDENFVQFLTRVFILLLFLQAITFCPNIPVYYTNRALCHLKRKYVFYSSFGCILCLGLLILVCDWDCGFL